MSKRSNTFPYTNAREAGRTNPGLVEVIEKTDPRHWSNAGKQLKAKPNRADRRAWARRWHQPSTVKRSAGGRTIARPKCPHGTPLPYPWSTPEPHCKACAIATTARLAKEKQQAELLAAVLAVKEAAASKPVRRRRTTKAAAEGPA